MSSETAGLVAPSPLSTPDAPLKAIAIVTAGIVIFGVQDVIIRFLSAEYSAMQIMFIRGLVAILPISLMVCWEGGWAGLATRHPFLNGARGLLMVVSYTTYYMSLAALPIAEVTAVFFISPIIVTLLSALFLAETVGLRRWAAVFVGFLGVLVIARPGSGALDPAAALPLAGSLAYAMSIIITRRIGRTQTGSSLAFFAMGVFILVSGASGALFADGGLGPETHPSLAFLFRQWVMPDLRGGLLLAACGVISACGFYCLSQGYRIAPASIVAPFEFIAMPMAVIWGLVFWREVPPPSTVLGIAMILASGLYVLNRETVRKHPLSTGRGIRFRL